MDKTDETIKIELIKDMRKLKQWNYHEYCIQLSNPYASCLIPISRLSFNTIEREVDSITHKTEIYKDMMKKQEMEKNIKESFGMIVK